MAFFRSVSLLTLMVGLAACGKGDKDANLAALDALIHRVGDHYVRLGNEIYRKLLFAWCI